MGSASNITEGGVRPPYFYGWYGGASAVMLTVCSIGILLETAFIKGAFRLGGWQSNFSYYLLIAMALCGLEVYVFLFIVMVLYLFVPSIMSFAVLRFFGNCMFLPYITSLFLNVLLTCHRFFFTLEPWKGIRWFPPVAAKATMIVISSLHCACIIYLQFSSVLTNTYKPKILNFGPYDHFDQGFDSELLYTVNSISNYVTGIFNLIAYPLLFLILYLKGNLTFRRNAELKMTIQVAISVVLELLLFIYWETASINSDIGNLIGNTSDLSYFVFLILPYLLFNRNVQRNILCGKEKPMVQLPQVSVVASSGNKRKQKETTI